MFKDHVRCSWEDFTIINYGVVDLRAVIYRRRMKAVAKVKEACVHNDSERKGGFTIGRERNRHYYARLAYSATLPPTKTDSGKRSSRFGKVTFS